MVHLTYAFSNYFPLLPPVANEPAVECLDISLPVDSHQFPELQHLLQKYSTIFLEPKSLSPLRGHFDHKIPLIPGAIPVSIRPYRYPLKQRDIIENLVSEMLISANYIEFYMP
ncbi:hypothetical protein RND81_07G138000 [Saponaria officinalis]|uniref:Uncharacterized protein n=1 Tax=Saponaria officinalis TaxID=3572 RepID=A0AAW1JN62_SAPOF